MVAGCTLRAAAEPVIESAVAAAAAVLTQTHDSCPHSDKHGTRAMAGPVTVPGPGTSGRGHGLSHRHRPHSGLAGCTECAAPAPGLPLRRRTRPRAASAARSPSSRRPTVRRTVSPCRRRPGWKDSGPGRDSTPAAFAAAATLTQAEAGRSHGLRPTYSH